MTLPLTWQKGGGLENVVFATVDGSSETDLMAKMAVKSYPALRWYVDGEWMEVTQVSNFWANFSLYSCTPTGMCGPTGIFWANLTPFSLPDPDAPEEPQRDQMGGDAHQAPP